MSQKTWVELFGVMTNNDMVSGKDIVRATGRESRVRLWTFDSEQQACQAFNQWITESCAVWDAAPVR